MGLFNQKKDTVEWIEYRPDVLFYKWKNREIKKGSRLVIRAGQKAIFYSGGRIHGIFENEGTYDIDTQIIPFLTHINAALHLRSDTGERAEVYFVNSKDLTLNWGTTQRIMIPTPEVPSGNSGGHEWQHGHLFPGLPSLYLQGSRNSGYLFPQ